MLKKNSNQPNPQPIIMNKVKSNSVIDKKIPSTSGSLNPTSLLEKKPASSNQAKGKENLSILLNKESTIISVTKQYNLPFLNI